MKQDDRGHSGNGRRGRGAGRESSRERATVYYTVTLAYDVLVAGLPGEDPRSVARRAIEQEAVRTGESPRAVAVDGQPLPSPARGRPPT